MISKKSKVYGKYETKIESGELVSIIDVPRDDLIELNRHHVIGEIAGLFKSDHIEVKKVLKDNKIDLTSRKFFEEMDFYFEGIIWMEKILEDEGVTGLEEAKMDVVDDDKLHPLVKGHVINLINDKLKSFR